MKPNSTTWSVVWNIETSNSCDAVMNMLRHAATASHWCLNGKILWNYYGLDYIPKSAVSVIVEANVEM